MAGRNIPAVLRGLLDDAQRAMETSLAARTLADATADVERAERQRGRKKRARG